MLLLRNNPQPLRKEEKPAYPARLPPAFWDKLSEVPLTKNALRELERRKPHQPGTQPNTAQHLDEHSPTERERIKRFARIGGPDLSHLRGVGMGDRRSHLGRQKRPSASASESTPTVPPTSTKKTSPYDRAFQQLLIDHGIYPDNYEYPSGQVLPPPENLEEIMQTIVKPQPSLSPSRFTREDFEQFKRANARARKEWQVISDVIPIIEGKVMDSSYVSGQVPFTNLEDPTGGLLVPGNPDRYYGARPEQLDREVRIQLNKHIVPSTQHDLPIVPNFFLNVKGPGGTPEVAEHQACYDGALGARGMNSLQRYSDPEWDANNKAYTLTSTYQKGHLNIYAIYPLSRASLEMPREYAMMQINAYAITGNIDNFRIGVGAYRNARDWAKQKRDEAIRRANETAARNRRDT
ncbi:hypothetical protein F5B22DRAFT_660367 [Xylaria bambusicola]|uniref:uncharacterized protein n=1 Tax=Xylaria bambusicola TaxID=326684 RepID=UPI002007480C|nr:uncharacterized protein F5B22DRAFT_660367 [Xylaria bambusicola]KAI0506291.1 hypothetical protein F5B22DRAFT_660367 [Xylaria bambusicola]